MRSGGKRVLPRCRKDCQARSVIYPHALSFRFSCQLSVHATREPHLRLCIEPVRTQDRDASLCRLHGLVHEDSVIVAEVRPEDVHVVCCYSGAKVQKLDSTVDCDNAHVLPMLGYERRSDVEGSFQSWAVHVSSDWTDGNARFVDAISGHMNLHIFWPPNTGELNTMRVISS